MAVKTTGAEFKRFYEDPVFWPEDTWHEDTVITVDDNECEDIEVEAINDSSIVVIEGGVLMGPQWEHEGPSLETYFKRWRKQQTTSTFLVQCDNAKLDAIKAAIKAAGGRIV